MFDAVWMKDKLWKYVELIAYFKLVEAANVLKQYKKRRRS